MFGHSLSALSGSFSFSRWESVDSGPLAWEGRVLFDKKQSLGGPVGVLDSFKTRRANQVPASLSPLVSPCLPSASLVSPCLPL